MTFDDDFVRLCTRHGNINTPLKDLGIEWPPPEVLRLQFGGEFQSIDYRRVRMSNITDEQRAEMTHVARGAEYRLAAETH